MNIRGKLSVLDLHPEEVARQITLIDHSLFRAIRPREFLNTAWMKSDKEVRAPGILNMINNFNKVCKAFFENLFAEKRNGLCLQIGGRGNST